MTKHAIPVLIITTLISYNTYAAVELNNCIGAISCPSGQTLQYVSKPGCTTLVGQCVDSDPVISCMNADNCGDVTCICDSSTGKCQCTLTGICNTSSQCSSGSYTRYICKDGYYGTCTGNASAASNCTCTKCPNFDGTVWSNRPLNLTAIQQYGYTGDYVPLVYSDTTARYIRSAATTITGCYLKASSSGTPEYEDGTGYFELSNRCTYKN